MSAKVPTNGAKAITPNAKPLTMNAKPLRNRVNFPLSVCIPSALIFSELNFRKSFINIREFASLESNCKTYVTSYSLKIENAHMRERVTKFGWLIFLFRSGAKLRKILNIVDLHKFLKNNSKICIYLISSCKTI